MDDKDADVNEKEKDKYVDEEMVTNLSLDNEEKSMSTDFEKENKDGICNVVLANANSDCNYDKDRYRNINQKNDE